MLEVVRCRHVAESLATSGSTLRWPMVMDAGSLTFLTVSQGPGPLDSARNKRSEVAGGGNSNVSRQRSLVG